jgi:hypothetical protein
MPPLNWNCACPYFSSWNGYGPKRAAYAAIIVFTFDWTGATPGAVSG